MQNIPDSLLHALQPISGICGHYGVGKTNFTCNLARDLAMGGYSVTVIDLDLVNPYFRVSEQADSLKQFDIEVISPVFAGAGSSLDVPSLRGTIEPALEQASNTSYVLIDIGGDDAGTTALGRFKRVISQRDFALLGVVNAFRNLIQKPEDAVANLREIEQAAGLKISALIDNTHLQFETTIETIEKGLEYSHTIESLSKLPLAAYTIPRFLVNDSLKNHLMYPIDIEVSKPWEV